MRLSTRRDSMEVIEVVIKGLIYQSVSIVSVVKVLLARYHVSYTVYSSVVFSFI